MTRWLVVVFLLALSAPAAAQDTVAFRTVARDDGASGKESRRVEFTFTTQSRWSSFWKRLAPSTKRPRVDFSKHMLIAVTQGRRTSGGHAIRITKINRTDDGWVVHVLETYPGEGCPSTQQITRPYHVVRVPRTGEDVSFERTRTMRDC